MKIVLLVALLAISADEQPATAPAAEPSSIREQIKADRARAKADEQNAPKTRFWDRGTDDKRPWDASKEIPLSKE